MSAAPAVRLDHVGLCVPDLEEAVAFFVEAFGATVVFRLDRIRDPEGGSMQRIGANQTAEFEAVMIDVAGARLELLQWWSGESKTGQPAAMDVGASHLALQTPDIHATLAALRQMPGVVVMGEPVTFTEGATPGLSNAFVRAPWGTILELVTWGA
ncbi:VOC family protein [Arthrobacter sp. 35W]|uniref:VOC family protein n=1 Tax=Arthrobacter sp. 35W TaxID=1132441 RepID=UPI0003FB5ACF|nr:VOC family protein [Arthrobacter sp. 35W]